ncbi:MAG: PatB family C-S lyase [Pseudomonadota bacterium]
MDFDTLIDRRGTHCAKWDRMHELYGVSPEDGIAMWVADTDFRPPQAVLDAVARLHEHGVFGYFADDASYRAAISWWMKTRHKWEVAPQAILSTHGLVNAVSLALAAYSEPGDGVILHTPVYHAFARVIAASGRRVVECEMPVVAGRYRLDPTAWEAQLTGNERILILCSPHNPGGMVWSAEELRAVADFARAHDLILISDEVHHDLVYDNKTHIPTQIAAPDSVDRLVVLTAASKTFNIAGADVGNAIIPDPALRKRFQAQLKVFAISPSLFVPPMVEAAYSPEGAVWVDELVGYLDGNRRLFDEAVNAIPGLYSMPLEATYLSWVDFDGTGMTREEFTRRVEQDACIAVNHGPTFGQGGDSWLRFNIATPRARVQEAVERLAGAFADLQ